MALDKCEVFVISSVLQMLQVIAQLCLGYTMTVRCTCLSDRVHHISKNTGKMLLKQKKSIKFESRNNYNGLSYRS